ncbi:MAG: hypothetical protein KC877_03375 [Candidatus Kaiserbacteria bacterium]|nr:hypothetical protein [Candidatus Kaiserbacteria bacterium]MCB9815874.1 hypothetical protein [Candidatus Nomurabacteria bacterium]
MTNRRATDSVVGEFSRVAEEVLDDAQMVVDTAEVQIQRVAAPVRKSILKRFPVLFLLAVTFGFTATITGMEQLLIRSELLQDHPAVILAIGIFLLVATGTLYKKLG